MVAREPETSLPDFIAGDEPVGPHYHPKLARFVVALALILFSTMIGLILFHWMRTSPPDAYLQVSGETRQNGIVVEVIDNGASDHSSVPQTLAAGNKYTARFPLAPGEYT